MALVVDPRHRAWLEENRWVNIYEDQLMSYLLVAVLKFDITTYEGYTISTGKI